MANSVIITYQIHHKRKSFVADSKHPVSKQDLYEPLLAACMEAMEIQPPPFLHIYRNHYGKPYLADFPEIDFNIAHSKNITVCCMGQGVRTGIDIEYLQPVLGFDIQAVQHILPKQYIAEICRSATPDVTFMEYWTKLESIIKANGKGYTHSPHDIDLQNNDGALLGNDQWHLQKIPIHQHFMVHLATDKKIQPPKVEALQLVPNN